MGICCITQGTQTGALQQPRGVEWEERWDICIPMADLFDVWQEPTQY